MVRTTIKDLEVANREFTIDSKAAIVTLIRPEDSKGAFAGSLAMGNVSEKEMTKAMAITVNGIINAWAGGNEIKAMQLHEMFVNEMISVPGSTRHVQERRGMHKT